MATGGDRVGDVRIVVADDEVTIRSALVELIGLRPGLSVVGGAADGAEAVALAKAHRPDIALLDADMPVMSGIEACAVLAPLGVKVVILTASVAPSTMRDAMNAGASGYVTKATAVDELADIIGKVARGQSYVDPQLAASVLSAPQNPLSTREIEVLRLVLPGTPVADIAEELHLAVGTVRNYLSSAMSALGARNRHEAARMAVQKGWV
ncbi:response regulator transcription factor [Rhodococcoides corynebacterioides]|uniref:response regulator transcription factor n=1 Tax=Rhodococcoides corynebacterioides TaxID=53972 RepID=UPI001C9AE43A|nr:response regulator transcription factor [Rhodococcus corynebacterioides]